MTAGELFLESLSSGVIIAACSIKARSSWGAGSLLTGNGNARF